MASARPPQIRVCKCFDRFRDDSDGCDILVPELQFLAIFRHGAHQQRTTGGGHVAANPRYSETVAETKLVLFFGDCGFVVRKRLILLVQQWYYYTVYKANLLQQYYISTINPFRTAVPFWEQSTQISSSLSPKRDCGPKRVNTWYLQQRCEVLV